MRFSSEFDGCIPDYLMGARAASGEAGPALPSSRLDRSTLLDRLRGNQPSERRLRVRLWQNAGVVQVGWGVYKPEQKKPGSSAKSDLEREHNQLRATRRAAAHIRRDLLTIGADRMLTLTYRENMTDRTRAIADLIRFNRAMRQRFENWASVSVLEWQVRGAAHFHVGISGFYDVTVVREVWRSIVGEGNIDIRFKPDGRGNACSKLAAYMGKYLQKDLDEGRKPGEHRYFRCQIVDHPGEVFYLPEAMPLGGEKDLAYEIIQATLGVGGVALCGFWMSSAGIGGAGYASAERGSQNKKEGV